MYLILSYICYLIAILAGYTAAYGILIQMFPDYGLLELSIGFVGTAMFFPLIPLYPAISSGDWTIAIVCYIFIMFGVILGNYSRKSKA